MADRQDNTRLVAPHGPVSHAIAAMRVAEPDRRSILKGALTLPFAGGASAAVAGPLVSDADADLVMLCKKLMVLKDWVCSPDFPDTDEMIEIATERDSELCRLISRTPARTQLGLMWKARLTAREHGLNRFINWNGVDPLPTDDCDLLLISLVTDVMHVAEAA